LILIVGIVQITVVSSPTTKIECDRATGKLRVVYPFATHEVALVDVVAFDLGSEGHGLGRGAHVETIYGIVAKLRDGERKLTTYTAHLGTVASYRDAIARLRAFQAGIEPTLSLTFNTEQSQASRSNDMWNFILVAVLSAVGVVFLLWRHLRTKPEQGGKLQ
jgi:hypothetical protein